MKNPRKPNGFDVIIVCIVIYLVLNLIFWLQAGGIGAWLILIGIAFAIGVIGNLLE